MITYDIYVPIGIEQADKAATVKCHDTGANLRIFLEIPEKISKYRSRMKPYTIPDGSTAILKVKKPDNTYTLTDGKIEGSSIYFEPVPQTFTAMGVAEAEVSLYGQNDRRLTSASFLLVVTREAADDCAEDSSSYVDILAEQIAAVNAAAEEAAKKAVSDKLDTNQGAENAGKALVIDDDGNVVPGEVQGSGGDGENGATYTPHVDADGKLSWTNDKGLPNPETVNIHGKDGIDGKDGQDGYTPQKGVDYFDGQDGVDGKDGYTPQKGIDYFDGKDGKDGVDGKNGVDGKDGRTPVKGTDYFTEADKEEIAKAAADLVDIPEGTTDHTLGISGASVGQIARITAVDGDGVPTAWESVDLPSGGSGGDSLGDFELFTEVVTDNAETSMFDFSTNEAGQSLAEKNYKEVFLVSPDKSSSGVNASGSAADVSAKVLINGKFTIYIPTFGRAGGGVLYVGLIVKDGSIDVLVHGRDGFQYLPRSGTMDVLSSFEAAPTKLSKVYTKYSYNGTMGKIEVSPKVEKIESLVVTITNGYSGSNVTYKIWGRA